MNTDYERVQTAAQQLIEHFDSVQIFVTRHEPPEGTFHINFGLGNLFAREGQIRSWLVKGDQQCREDVKKEQ